MKKLYLIIGLSFLFTTTKAQQWDWSTHLVGHYGAHMDEDSTGNIYTALGVAFNPNVFQFSKMDSTGIPQWTNNLNCAIADLKVGKSRVVISGYFVNQATFGNVTLTSVGLEDGFVAEYDLAGNFKWVKQASGVKKSSITSIDINGNDDVFVSMSNDSTTNFNGAIFSKGIAVCVLNKAGTLADNFQINGKVFSAEISIDTYDNIYLIGSYSDSALVIGTTTITGCDVYYGSYFLAKLHRNGNLFWAKDYYTKFKRSVSNLRIAKDGNIYLTEMHVYLEGQLQKLSANGILLWSKPIGSTIYAEAYDMKLDKNANIYITGLAWDSVKFGNCLINGNNYFLYVSKLDSSGSCYWVKTGQSADQSYGLDLSIKNPHVMVLGIAVNDLVIQLPPISVPGTYFLAKISSSGSVGIKPEPDKTPNISVYPNPSNGKFIIESAENFLGIEIFNVLGEKVYSSRSPAPGSAKTEIDLGKYVSDVYTIHLKYKEAIVVKKFVVGK